MKPTKRIRTAPEIIAFHLGWDINDVKDGLYQRYTPPVYVCGGDYFCCPAIGGPKPHKDFKWELVGAYYGRDVYHSKQETE